jgi:hypothetical protein
MNSRTLTRQELYKLVWSKPATKLAQELGTSDAAITKLCRKFNIPKPGPGYWKTLEAGFNETTPPLPPAGPGISKQIVIWHESRNQWPFQPEVLKRIEEDQLPANRIQLAKDLSEAHPLVSYTKQLLANRKPNAFGVMSIPSDLKIKRSYLQLSASPKTLPRALLIMDALLRALEARGCRIESGERTEAIVEGEKIGFYLWEDSSPVREMTPEEKAKSAGKWIYELNGKLVFTIDEWQAERKNWRDGQRKRLEDQLNEIVVGIISTAEIIRLRNLQWAHDRQQEAEARLRRQQERRRRELLEAHSALWEKSRSLQLFLNEYKEFLSEQGRVGPDCEEAQWLRWACDYADSLDPFKSGELQRAIQDLNPTL